MLDKKKIQILLKLLEEGEEEKENLTLHESLELINKRLERIETLLFRKRAEDRENPAILNSENKATCIGKSGEIPIVDDLPIHPSHEKFFSLKSLAEENHGICPFEPTPKLCDHCLMCSCRGF